MLSTNDIIHYSILEQRDTFMNPWTVVTVVRPMMGTAVAIKKTWTRSGSSSWSLPGNLSLDVQRRTSTVYQLLLCMDHTWCLSMRLSNIT